MKRRGVGRTEEEEIVGGSSKDRRASTDPIFLLLIGLQNNFSFWPAFSYFIVRARSHRNEWFSFPKKTSTWHGFFLF